MTDKILLLLDTDIGSDIDDAVCLAYLLRHPRCELLGVTTVTGDTRQRAEIADVLCHEARRDDVPIHPGATAPLLIGPGQPGVPHYEAIAKRPRRTGHEPGTAIEFLRQTIRRHRHKITLLAIGPLTNLALLFSVDPELPSLLKELVLMGGVFTSGNGHGPGAREWNAMVDPIATAMVFRSCPPRLTAVGLDVTTRCHLPADDCRRRFDEAGGPLKVVAEMAEIWFRDKKQITFHDPLAAAIIFEPSLCGYDEGEVSVETVSPSLAGLTKFKKGSERKPHRIAVTVCSEDFFTHYFGIVSA